MTSFGYKLLLCIGLLSLGSCSPTRYVGQGERLLTQVRLTQAREGELHLDEYTSYIAQQPNHRLFGLFNWSLGIYNLSDLKSNSFINRNLRRLGSPPVILNPEEAEYSRLNLTTALYNAGYLNAKVSLSIDTLRDKRASLTYHLDPGEPFLISQAYQSIASQEMDSLIHPTDTLAAKRLSSRERYASLLDSGVRFSPNLLEAERRRLVLILRNRGYWGLREDHIRFEVDTLERQEVWVHTRLDSLVPAYRIASVRLLHGGVQPRDPGVDSLTGQGISIYVPRERYLKPQALLNRLWVLPGQLYSQEYNQRTYSALSDLGALRDINIRFVSDSLSSEGERLLHCEISTGAERSKEFSIDAVGTHSSGNLGAISSLTFKHNNLFSAAEELTLVARVGYENLRQERNDHLSYGFESSIRFPRALTPFGLKGIKALRQMRVSTDLRLSYDYNRRPEFNRNLLSASLGYTLQRYGGSASRHQLKLLEVDYMHFGYIDEAFRNSMPIITQLLHYRDQFVVGAAYTFNYNSQKDYRYLWSRTSHDLRLHVQSAGALLYGLSRLMRSGQDKYGAYSLLKTNFAQFVKGEFDYSILHRLSARRAWAGHIALGAILPYGNSHILPIDLRYFAGGANSIRGWSVRSLGPGSVPLDQQQSIFDRVGDLKLELSAEYRARVTRSIELALFADAGNIWTLRRYENQPQGEFRFDRFYKEIALSAGMGLRWDFDFFLLRFDTGLKIHSPQEHRDRRWVLGYKPLGDLLSFHFALGYPF